MSKQSTGRTNRIDETKVIEWLEKVRKKEKEELEQIRKDYPVRGLGCSDGDARVVSIRQNKPRWKGPDL